VEQLIFIGVPLAVIIAAIIFAASRLRTSTIIYPDHQGLLYTDGKLMRTLGSGRYHRFPNRSRIDVHDMRRSTLNVGGQEIMTKDNIAVRVSLVGYSQVSDLERAVSVSTFYQNDLHAIAQLAVRTAVSGVTLDELLSQKSALNAELQAEIGEKALTLGVTVTEVAILDVMLPAILKKAFSGLIEAQKDALIKLEKARGEHAVLRSLANSAKLYEANPAVAKARVMQALDSGNNSIVFGGDGQPKIG
jgi:regulator of protease activity HflC (stomatin/prohibitin superfamily)